MPGLLASFHVVSVCGCRGLRRAERSRHNEAARGGRVPEPRCLVTEERDETAPSSAATRRAFEAYEH